MPNDPNFDVVQHPTLGRLMFPKDMPFDERNESIDRQMKLRSARAEQQQMMDNAKHLGSGGVHPSFPAFGTGYIPSPEHIAAAKAQQQAIPSLGADIRTPSPNAGFFERYAAMRENEASTAAAGTEEGWNPMPGLRQAGQAAAAIAHRNANMDTYSNLIEGGFGAMKPLMQVSAAASPIKTAATLGGFMVGQPLAQKGLERMGVDPSTARLGTNVAALGVGAAALGPEYYDYIRGARYASQLRATGMPESEVLSNVANPPWKESYPGFQKGFEAPTPKTPTPFGAMPLQYTEALAQQQALPEQRPAPTPMPRPTEAAPMVPPKPAEGSMSPLGNQPIAEKPPMASPRNAKPADVPTGPPQDLMGPGDRGLDGKQRYEQIDELMQHMSDSLPPSLLDKVRDHLFIDSNPDGSVGYYVTPPEEGGPHLSSDEHDILQGAVEEYTNANSLDAARGQRASETPQEQVERVEREQAGFHVPDTPFPPTDPETQKVMDEHYKFLANATPVTLDELAAAWRHDPESGKLRVTDYDRATLESHNAAMSAPPVKDVLPLKPDDLKTPSPAGPRSANEPTPQGQQATSSSSTQSLSKADKENLDQAHHWETAAASAGWHEGIEPLREAVRGLKLGGPDSLYIYQNALAKFVRGMRASKKWALKDALDYIDSRKDIAGNDPKLNMQVPGWRSLSRLVSRYRPGTPEYEQNARVVTKGLYKSAADAVNMVSPHVGGLRFDGWTWGDPFSREGSASYGAPLTVNVTHMGTGGTFAAPLNVASDPALLHTFISKALEPFGVKVSARVAAAGSDGASFGLFPIDALENALKFVTRDNLDLSPGAEARKLMRANIGKLTQDKSRLFAKFSTPEIDPKSLPLASRTLERAKLALSRFGVHSQLESAISRWDSAGPERFRAWTDKMETGDLAGMSPQDAALAGQMRTLLDQRWEKITKVVPAMRDNYIENYFPHLWKDPVRAADVAQSILGSRRPLASRAGFLKERVYGYMSEGLDAGLEPVTYNPVRMSIMRLHEMDRFLMAHTVKDQLGKAEVGLTRWVPGFNRPPDGWKELNDRIFRGSKIGDDGLPDLTGKWYAPPEVASVINNYLSPGLRGQWRFMGKALSGYDMLRGYGNALNQVQLGLSPFHLYFTMQDAVASKMSIGLEQLEHGYVGKGLANVVKSVGFPFAIAENFIRGNRLMAEYLRPGSYSQYAWLADMVAKSNGAVEMDPYYKNFQIDRMFDAFRKGVDDFRNANYGSAAKSFGKGTLAAPFSAIEYMAKPLMEHWVPRMKLGVFTDMVSHAHERLVNGEINEAQFRDIANKNWDSVDNRMGQLRYDNLFWHRTLKDVLMLSVRSVGWNVGTWRELGGAVKDLSQLKLTRRVNYAMSLTAVHALLMGMTTYMYTGQFPSGKDYLAARTNRLDENGQPERVLEPTYWRDILSVSHETANEPTHIPWHVAMNKLQPWIQQVGDLLHNQDFFGTEIIHTADPAWKQGAEAANYIWKSYRPLSLSNYQERQSRVASKPMTTTDKVLSYGLLNPAPRYIGQSKGEEFFYNLAHSEGARGPKTQQQFTQSDYIRHLRNQVSADLQYNKGKVRPETNASIQADLKSGKLPAHALVNILKEARLKPLQRAVLHADVSAALEGWSYLSPDERKLVLPQMLSKMRDIGNQPPEQQPRLTEGYQQIVRSYPKVAAAMVTNPLP